MVMLEQGGTWGKGHQLHYYDDLNTRCQGSKKSNDDGNGLERRQLRGVIGDGPKCLGNRDHKGMIGWGEKWAI